MYFCGLLGRQIQGPPRAAHTLSTPLFVKFFYPNERPSCWQPFAGDIFAREGIFVCQWWHAVSAIMQTFVFQALYEKAQDWQKFLVNAL